MVTFALVTAVWWAAGEAFASCGLDHCPSPEASAPRGDVVARARARVTTFDQPGVSGSYTELLPNVEYLGWTDVVVGGTLPVVVLSAGEESETGVGNGVIYGAWTHEVGVVPFGAGVQIELPWGSGGAISDDHWVVLPYVIAHVPLGPVFAMVNTGLQQSLGGHTGSAGSHDHGHAHDHGSKGVFVNPHEETEWLFRGHLGASLASNRITPLVSLAMQRPLWADRTALLAQAGAGVRSAISSAVALRAMAEWPVTDARRFESRVSLGLEWRP